ncbi:BZIP domain-containing protein [Chloropicon primus]|uniref:BZIP domain-containing protein n=1 Tax=Chloropicon primus TaxID=1764295 RepID=A0A5B8MQ16_9CHLO|nr:hypothetical protein A3770_07p49590 [Chloropicon primus]UPR01659.1 BZIP domain-containing protein [Chloropicon primus]|eukprot:QDZ22441.1 hypothetical protein A3770_07p49590 [Chloropicon primus]
MAEANKEKPRRRAEAVDLRFDNHFLPTGQQGVGQLQDQNFFQPSGEHHELPDPIPSTSDLLGSPDLRNVLASPEHHQQQPGQEDDVLIRLGSEKANVPALKRHRRCSSDTFFMLLKELAIPDLELLGESSNRSRRPTIDTVMQDEILRILDSPPNVPYASTPSTVDPGKMNLYAGPLNAGHGQGASPASVVVEGHHLESAAARKISSNLRRNKSMPPIMSTGGFARGETTIEDDLRNLNTDPKKKRKRDSVKSNSSADDMPPKAERSRALSLMDDKKAKRILANRISAQKSRMKKLQFVGNLENTVSQLYKDVALLQPQLEVAKAQRESLIHINDELRKQLDKLESKAS